MRTVFTRSLITLAAVGVLELGCGEQTASDAPASASVLVPSAEVPANANETELVFYQDLSGPVLADVWLPPNDHGATLAELYGDAATRRLDKVMLYRDEERGVVIRLGAEGLLGTTAEVAGGVMARIEAIEGDAWTWAVTGPEGERIQVRTVVAEEAADAPLYSPPVRAAVLQIPVTRSGYRPARFAVNSAIAPVEMRTPEGVPPGGLSAYLSGSGCEPSQSGVFCDVEVSQRTGDLHLSSWVRTDLSSLPEGTLVYQTIADCRAAQEELGVFGLQLGGLVSAIGVAVSEAGFVAPGGPAAWTIGGLFVLGSVAAGAATYQATPSCVALTSNEAIRNAAFDRFSGATVAASWVWSINAADEAAGWTATGTPGGASVQPFLPTTRSGIALPPVVVTITPPKVDDAPVPEARGLEGTTFSGQLDTAVLSQDPVVESDAPLTVTLGTDGHATVDLRVRYRTDENGRPGCFRAEGVARGVAVGSDGAFTARVPVAADYFEGPAGSGDACARLDLSPASSLPVAGRLDAATGQGTATVRWFPELTDQSVEVVLTRE